MTSHQPTRLLLLVPLLALLALSCSDDWLEDDAAETSTSSEADAQGGSQAASSGAVQPVGGATLALGEFAFATDDCPFDIEIELTVDCGYLEVPESRTGLSTSTITVAVAILRTPASAPAGDPVVFLQGGPGGVSLAEHWAWLSDLDDWRDHPLLANRDLVLVDQRGTGYSQPSLACDDEGGETPDDCYARLMDAGISVASFSTPENAADLAALRIALGYDEWNVFGSSYGTRLALAIVRDYPQGVRSIVLDGVYPPNTVPSYEAFIDNALGAFAAFDGMCAQQPDCRAAYGSISDLMAAALTAIEGDPSAPYDGYEFVDYVFEAMYSTDTAADIPVALTLALAGDYVAAVDMLDGSGAGVFRGNPASDSSGKFHAVECREEHPFTDLAAVEERFDELYDAGVSEILLGSLYGSVWSPVESVCPSWDVGEADPRERAPVVSDVAALVLSGVLDPVTPPAWGALAAETLPNSTHLVTPLSHSTVLEDPCVDTIVAAFLDDPTATLDLTCVASIAPPYITVP